MSLEKIFCPRCGKTTPVEIDGKERRVGRKIVKGQRCRHCWVDLS